MKHIWLRSLFLTLNFFHFFYSRSSATYKKRITPARGSGKSGLGDHISRGGSFYRGVLRGDKGAVVIIESRSGGNASGERHEHEFAGNAHKA